MVEGRRFYPEVESLRGIAALAVMMLHVVGHHHVFGATGPQPSVLHPFNVDTVLSLAVTTVFNGQAAVILFFTISGFVLAESLRGDSHALASPINYLGFLIRRLARIVPLMWASLLFMAAVYLYCGVTVPIDTLTNAMFLGESIGHFNGVLWTMRVELVMSVIFPFLFVANYLLGRAGALALAAWFGWLTYRQLPGDFAYILCFQLGIMLPDHGRWMMTVLPPRWRAIMASTAFAFFLVSFNLQRLELFVGPGSHVTKIVLSFVVLAYVVYGSDQLRERLCAPLWRWLGKVSYGVYLFHSPMNFLATSILVPVMPLAIREQTVLFGLMCLSIVLPGTLLLSWAGYHWIERPFIALGRSLTARRHNPKVIDGAPAG